jgi:hypothetical protein
VASHIEKNQSHVRKFSAFIAKNEDALFVVKRTVWQSALKGVIFYSCESWLCENLKAAMQFFLTTQKILLGVRPQTYTDLVHSEVGTGTTKSFIQRSQQNILKK